MVLTGFKEGRVNFRNPGKKGLMCLSSKPRRIAKTKSNCHKLSKIDLFTAMVMADVTVITDLMHEEEKRIKTFLEGLGQKLKDKGVRWWYEFRFSR